MTLQSSITVKVVLACLVVCLTLPHDHAFVEHPRVRSGVTFWPTTTHGILLAATPDSNKSSKDGDNEEEPKEDNKILGFLFNPYGSKIPKEMEAEIYRAEGNTVAAQDRGKRVALYAAVALVLVGCAFFNGFLTELRHNLQSEGMEISLQEIGFGWVQANFLFSFLFLNKIGGGLSLISGAASGMLAEAELDSRRKNAERIWEELERRRNLGSSPSKNSKKTQPDRKKKRSAKQVKRLEALSEVIREDEDEIIPTTTPIQEEPELAKDSEGIMGKLKGWYEKADSMAASQALLLNKELEDKGVLEKITDETGLKVIGKEAAAKLQVGNQTKQDARASRSDGDTST